MINSILGLHHSESVILSTSNNDDCGVAEVWLINDSYLLFEIPQYGGDPIFTARFTASKSGAKCIEIMVRSWT